MKGKAKTKGQDTQVTEEKYETLIKNIPDAIYSALPDETGTTTFMSPRWKDWTGYVPEDFYSDHETWPKCIHPEDREKAVQGYIDAVRRKKEYVAEYRVIHRETGEVRHLRDHGIPVKDKTGKVIRIDGIVTDITVRKKLEDNLKQAHERLEEKINKRTAELRVANKELKRIIDQQKQTEDELREITDFSDNMIDSSLDSIVVADISGCLTRVNMYFLKLLGYERKEEVLGKHIADFGPKKNMHYELTSGEDVHLDNKYFEDRKAMYNQLLREGRISNWQNYFVTKEVKLVPIEQNVWFLYNEKGDPIATVGIARDITERRQAEEALKKSEEKYYSLIEHSNDSIVSVNTSGKVMGFNKRAEEMFGYPREEVLGKSADLLVAPQNRERQQKALKELEDPGRDSKGNQDIFEGLGVTKEGEEFPVEFSFYTIETEGEIISTASIRDVSKRKMAEKEIMGYQNRLKALTSQLTLSEEKERRRFAEYLHNEIGQYLFASQIQLEQLKASMVSEENKEALNNIIHNIKQMIDKSRSLTFELSSPILHELGLKKALEWLVEHIYKQYNIRVELKDDRKEKLLNDDMKIFLYQAVRELLTNVAKHAQVKNAVVSIKKDNSNMQISVEDRGVGFSSLNADSVKDNNKGFGLFHINERVEQFGGHLEIESKPKRGTTITIVVPFSTT